MVDRVTVSSEQDAFDLLKRAINDELSDQLVLKFDNWPKLTVTLKGSGYDSTITPSLMQAMIDLQHGINRTYSKLIYDHPDSRHLKDAERQQLEFKAKVEQGSSVVEINLADFAQKLASELVGKMEPSQIVILGVVGASLWAATSMFKHYVSTQAKHKEAEIDADKLIKLSTLETERLSIVTQALQMQPRLVSVEKDAQLTSMSFLKGISDADSIDVNGIKLTNDEVRKVISTSRSESSEIQLNGNYRILSVDTSKEDEIKIKIRHLEKARDFWAKFKDNSLDKEHVRALQDAEWSKTPVYLSVNATELRGEVTTAVIISAKPQPT
ncbi:hypothetical protein [Collimonas sp.]|jgi:hypothetical protein|uniref:hypothetical protein n=1 Tax=Collimonas sp. TaxID=1963772 RepID=UPI002C5F68AC|nr:hypothetical protein [Collimonas sp.]HWX01451.1 hypothetical protein [Collimonas sp.]